MKRLILILIPLAIISLISSKGYSFDVTAQVSKDKISQSDSIILRITVAGGKAQVDTSIIQDFRVESRGSGTSVNIVNGNYSRTTSYTYLLFPLKTGTLKIPKIEVIDGSKIAYTEKITISVSEQEVDENILDNYFVKASISDSTLFTGQDAIYTFKFFSAATVYEARLEEHDIKNFYEKTIGKQKNYKKNINGKIYTVNEINYLIRPEKTGDFTIGPTSVIIKIDIDGGNNNGFDAFFSTRKTIKKISSNSINVKVTPLPPYTGQEEYTGLVGDFKIKAHINKTKIQVGESATLTLTVSGRGNIMDTSIENIPLPKDSFKIYDDKPETKEELDSTGYLKKKIFKKAIVPLKPGDFTIPEISLSYFDTKSGQYKRVITKPIIISITKSATNDESNLQVLKNDIDKQKTKKTEVEFTGRDILPLKQTANVLKNQHDLSFYLFVSLIVFPFAIFCLINFFKTFQKKEKPNSILMKQKAVNALKKAKNSKLPQEEFLNHIRTAVVSSILSKGDMTGESLTKDEAYIILQNSNLKNREIENILETFNNIDSAKYGGRSLEKDHRNELFSKAKHLIKLCSLIILTTSLIYFMPVKAQAAPPDESGTLFLEGVKEYKEGNFDKAAHKFETIALNGIKNGELFYNTANAFLKAGDVGKAILWYERAKKLIPFDADLKFNLDYTQEKLKDIKESKSINFTDILFFWKSYISSNLIRYFATFLSFIFFLYASIRILNRKKILTTSGLIVLIIFLLFLSTALFDYYQTFNANSAIIIPGKISVRSGLSADSTELFILHAGTKVSVDKVTGEFIRISFSKGKIGWVKKSDAIII